MLAKHKNKKAYLVFKSIVTGVKHDARTIMKKCSVAGLTEKEMLEVHKMIDNFYK